jgi:hypothetical protein
MSSMEKIYKLKFVTSTVINSKKRKKFFIVYSQDTIKRLIKFITLMLISKDQDLMH